MKQETLVIFVLLNIRNLDTIAVILMYDMFLNSYSLRSSRRLKLHHHVNFMTLWYVIYVGSLRIFKISNWLSCISMYISKEVCSIDVYNWLPFISIYSVRLFLNSFDVIVIEIVYSRGMFVTYVYAHFYYSCTNGFTYVDILGRNKTSSYVAPPF